MLAMYTVAAAMLFHRDFADQMQMAHFMKNIAITGGLFILAYFGPGLWSLDGKSKPASVPPTTPNPPNQ